ncbi:hypothetical protein [Conexibacter arvalis]|uniref:Glycosyl transferase family 2 n=1 Tax=Conexibacter arvalis TaxID=912552 RepID=A0A840I9B7_9ACTN|nr:hypothetical protein [Conexibacter arvalis]MBB4661507.1 hypothetical protein [Conexibacter arvalis]
MPGICLVHLVWAPLGTEPIRRFLDAYRQRPAGRDHRLLVVLNGFDGTPPPAVTNVLAEVEHEPLLLPERVQDLTAYRLAAEHAADADRLCFLNSHAEPLADGWLAMLDDQLRAPRVGIVGATGSNESHFSAAARPLKPLRRFQFPPFPNTHLRTNGFMLRRDDMLALDWSVGRTKGSAYRLESGNRGIVRQLLARGLEPRVVDRDGRGLEPHQWPESRTYRSGAQEQLLIADNRTRQYATASQERREWYASISWGTPAPARL